MDALHPGPADARSSSDRSSWPYLALIAVAGAVLHVACSCSGNSNTFGSCSTGATRCQDSNVEVCQANASGSLVWQQDRSCLPQSCQVDNGQAHCVDAATCQDGKKNQGESDIDCGGAATCDRCLGGKACNADSDCKSNACSANVCRVCKAQAASCLGNLVQVCKSDQLTFDTIATCDPVKGEACNAITRKCELLQPIGSAKATGTYYLFTMFRTGTTPFKGGYDVDGHVTVIGDSEENLIYINRSSQLDVYKVELLDTDKDGKLEPNQHPSNPDATGPVEERRLTFIKTYTNVTLGQPSVGEIFALKDRIYFLRRDTVTGATNIYEFVFQSGATNLLHAGNPKLPLAVLGYDTTGNRWYAGHNSATRRVYSFHPAGQGWAAAFDYPNLAGSHMDGLEVVQDPKTIISYV